MFLNVPVDELKPNTYQPWQVFALEELVALEGSITAQVILLPLCTFIENGAYFIGVGERRWRASMMAGKRSVSYCVTKGNPVEVALISSMIRPHFSRWGRSLRPNSNGVWMYPPGTIKGGG